MILYNGESLAYVGDSLYELEIRKHLLGKGLTDVNKMHKEAIKYTSGVNQAAIISYFLKEKILFDDEIIYYKRGRNANHSKNRRNISVTQYKMATGFEALIGYLYYSDNIARMNELINLAIKYVEEVKPNEEENGRN